MSLNRESVTKADIVRAAALVFRREGYRSSTMNQIAAEVGLGKASLYHHIKSKESLLIALADAALGQSLPAVERIAAESDMLPCQKLYAAVHQHVVVTTELVGEIAAFTLYVQEIKDDQKRLYYMGQRRRYGDFMSEFVASALRFHGSQDNVTLVTFAILGMCNWMQQWYSADRVTVGTPEEIANNLSTIAMRMVKCDCDLDL